jgi:hypothetical protein
LKRKINLAKASKKKKIRIKIDIKNKNRFSIERLNLKE